MSASGYRTCDTDIYLWQLTLGAAFRSALSAGLFRSFGFNFRRAGCDQFEIAGIPQDLIDAFSKRSKQIERTIQRFETSAVQREVAALATRESERGRSDWPLDRGPLAAGVGRFRRRSMDGS